MCSVGARAKPYDNTLGPFVYLIHDQELGALFIRISLVYANRIDPQGTARRSISQMAQSSE